MQPVAVRKHSDEEATAKRKEHEESGGNKASDVPTPDEDEAIQASLNAVPVKL